MNTQGISFLCPKLSYDDEEWHKDISKRNFSLARSEVVNRGVPSQCGKVGSQWFSLYRDYNAIVHTDGI